MSYTEAQKNKALAIYAETLNADEASRQTNIPTSTIKDWSNSEEGQAQIDSIRAAVRTRFAWEFVELANKGIAVLHDRLEHGDYKLLNNGEQVRVPVSAKDAASIVSMTIDKHALVTGAVDQGKAIKGAMVALADALGKLGQTAGDNAKIVIDQEDNPNPNVTNSEKVG